MLNEGTYLGQLIGGVTCKAGTGSDQVAIEFELTHEAINGEWSAIAATKRTLYISLTDKAMPSAIKKLALLGFGGDFRDPQFANSENVSLALRHDQFGGRITEKVELADFSGGDRTPVDDGVARRLNALYKAQAGPSKARPPGAPKPVTTKQAAAAVEAQAPPDDGVPF